MKNIEKSKRDESVQRFSECYLSMNSRVKCVKWTLHGRNYINNDRARLVELE